jgi:ubiquinone/menaquinone biosynthesis C-methylase UbiE
MRADIQMLSDEEWLSLLKRSLGGRLVDGLLLPGFPSAEVQSNSVGAAGEPALDEGYRFYRFAKDRCAELGTSPLLADSRVLDFGVGWGRMLRFFLKEVEAIGLHGVDVNADMLAACRKAGLPGTFNLIERTGRLPYPDSTFDLVYAYSVFTHLPEWVQDIWLPEIARVLRPGGVFIATVEPPRFIDYFLRDENFEHQWHRDMRERIKTMPNVVSALAETGFVYLSTGDVAAETYGDCVMTSNYVRRHWGAHFKIHDFVDDEARFWQAVVVATK